MRKVACNQYLISSDGSYFGHPDAEKWRTCWVFNYNTKYSTRWTDKGIKGAPQYTTRYPRDGEEGMVIDF